MGFCHHVKLLGASCCSVRLVEKCASVNMLYSINEQKGGLIWQMEFSGYDRHEQKTKRVNLNPKPEVNMQTDIEILESRENPGLSIIWT